MAHPRWYLDEIAHAGPEHLDPRYVATYDQKARTDYAVDLALLRDLGLDASKALIDLGAGTGTLALTVAPHCQRVVAVDPSAAMLAALREKIEQSHCHNVECVHGGFLSYQHAGAPADMLYSRNALHHLPDFWKAVALHRVAAMLKPGGVLRLRDLVFAFDVAESERAMEAWLTRAKERPEDGWTRTELETHLRDEFSTFTWLLEPMLERAGFTIHAAEYDDSRIYAAYVCVKN